MYCRSKLTPAGGSNATLRQSDTVKLHRRRSGCSHFLSCAEMSRNNHGDSGGEVNEGAPAVCAGGFGGFISVKFNVYRLFVVLVLIKFRTVLLFPV